MPSQKILEKDVLRLNLGYFGTFDSYAILAICALISIVK